MSMTAFPMDSQVTEMGEDGLPVYDRAFSSTDLREVMKTYFGNGYFAEDGTSLNVKAGDGLNVIVQAGKANIQGTLGFMVEDEMLHLDNSDKSNPRIDTVVVRLDLSLDKRCIELDVIHGTAATSPVAPTLTRSESIYELGLADVTIPANATAVTAENIKDTRLDADRCGVAEPFAKLDTTSLFEQVTAIINKTSEDATEQVGKLEKATADAVSAMNDALSSTVLGSVWRLQSSSTADYLVYGDDLNNITSVGTKFCDSASIAGGIQHKPKDVENTFVLYTFAAEQDPSRVGQMILTLGFGATGVWQYVRSGTGSTWDGWRKVGDISNVWNSISLSVSGNITSTSSLAVEDLTTYGYMSATATITVKVGSTNRKMIAPVIGAQGIASGTVVYSLTGCAEYDDGNDATLFFHLPVSYSIGKGKLSLRLGGAIGGSTSVQKYEIIDATLTDLRFYAGYYTD